MYLNRKEKITFLFIIVILCFVVITLFFYKKHSTDKSKDNLNYNNHTVNIEPIDKQEYVYTPLTGERLEESVANWFKQLRPFFPEREFSKDKRVSVFLAFDRLSSNVANKDDEKIIQQAFGVEPIIVHTIIAALGEPGDWENIDPVTFREDMIVYMTEHDSEK